MKTKTRLVKRKPKAKKIEARPLTENQILEFVAHYNKNKSFPGSKIPCNVTGKLTTCVGPWMVKKVKEFGGAENLLRKYTCRGALKAAKQKAKPITAKSKRKAKIKELKDEQKNWDIPKVNFVAPTVSSDSELGEITKTTCLRPDIHLNNDYYCNGCEFYDVCSSSIKRLANLNKVIKKYRK